MLLSYSNTVLSPPSSTYGNGLPPAEEVFELELDDADAVRRRDGGELRVRRRAERLREF